MHIDSQKKTGCICLVGALPPPVTGMTSVNAAMHELLSGLEIDLKVINLSPEALNRVWYVKFLRMGKAIRGLGSYLQLLWRQPSGQTTLYMCLSGGYGQFYELLFILASRWRKAKIFLHHHCSSYLSQPWWPTKLLTQIAGKQAVHITLCQEMGELLKNTYGGAEKVFVLSNAPFIDGPASIEAKAKLEKIAFLGNITAAKGIFEFLDVAEMLQQEGVEVKALVAGPFQNPQVEERFFQRLSELSVVEYVGPKYKEEKSSFYKSVDLLLFPTKYLNETEPLTIHEALASGVPAIAWGRGCIPNMIPPNAGLVVDPTADFVTKAVAQIKSWHQDPVSFQATSRQARQQFLGMKSKHTQNLETLICLMLSENQVATSKN